MLSFDQQIRHLLGLHGLTMQIRCDIVDIVLGLRPTARIMLRPGVEVETCIRELVSAEIAIAVGRGIKWQAKSQRVGVVDWMGEGASEAEEKFIVLYIAKSQGLAENSRAADEGRDDTAFGRELGYPLCCVSFVHDRGRVPEHRDVFSFYAAKGYYHPLCWPGAMAIDRSLLIHYPCGDLCMVSRSMAEKRWNYIQRFGSNNMIDLVRKAHSMIYWLDYEGHVCLGSQPPETAIAIARPFSKLS